jgi:hypothetical protein
MNALVMLCENAVTECAVVTSPLLGYNSETPDVLTPSPNWTPQPIFEPMLDVFPSNDVFVAVGGIVDFPI